MPQDRESRQHDRPSTEPACPSTEPAPRSTEPAPSAVLTRSTFLARSTSLVGSTSLDRSTFLARLGPLPLWGWTSIGMGVALILDLIVIHTISLWTADGATLETLPMGMRRLIDNRFAMGHLPWFFVAFQAWTRVAGTSLLALRFPALVSTLLTIPVIAALGTRLGGVRAAFLAMLIAVFHASLLRFSAEARMYGWEMLFGGLWMGALLRHADRPTAPRAALAGLFAFVLWQLHISSVFFIIAVGASMAALGAVYRLPRRWWIGFVGSLVVPVLLSVPVFVYMVTKIDAKEYEKFIREVGIADYLAILLELVIGIGQRTRTWKLPLAILFPALALFWICRRNPWRGRPTSGKSGDAVGSGVGGGIAGIDEPSGAGLSAGLDARGAAMFFFAVGLLTPAIPFLITVAGKPVFGEARYYIGVTAPLVALAGAGLASLRWERNWTARILALAFVAVTISSGELYYYRVNKVLFEGGMKINRLVADMEGKARGRTLLVICHSGAVPAIVQYYLTPNHPFTLVKIHRRDTPETIRAKIAEQIRPDEDLALFLYKAEDLEPTLLDIVRDEFGPWAEVKAPHKKEPTWYHFQREGHPDMRKPNEI